MTHSIKTLILSASVLMLIISSCKKESTEPTSTAPGALSIHFDNRAGTEALIFGNDYVNANGDTVRFSTFNYYISNIKLTRGDGSVWSQPYDSSYYLIKHNVNTSKMIEIPGVPAGDYTSISFVIGVDSAKSATDITTRTGVLDPATGAAGMYWSWNSGYIFMKVEGASPQAPYDSMANSHAIMYHIGGFGVPGMGGASINNIRTASLPFPGTATIAEGKECVLHIKADILEIFKSPTTVNVAQHAVYHSGAYTRTLSENYSDMFKVDHIHSH